MALLLTVLGGGKGFLLGKGFPLGTEREVGVGLAEAALPIFGVGEADWARTCSIECSLVRI